MNMYTHTVFLILILCCSLPVLAHHIVPSGSLSLIGLNKEALDGDYKMAVKLFKQAFDSEKNAGVKRNIDAHIKIANAVLDNKIKPKTAHHLYSSLLIPNIDDYIAELTKAINLNPEYERSYLDRSSAYREKNDNEAANNDLLKAIKLNNNFVEAYYQLGMNAVKDHKLEQAVGYYTKAIEGKPDYAYAYNNRGLIYAENGHPEKALEDFAKAIKINPKNAEPYGNRAVIFANNGKFFSACNELKKQCNATKFCESYHQTKKKGFCPSE